MELVPGYKILVVEDDKDISALVQEHLQSSGFEVVVSETAASAHKNLTSDLFDVIILDRMLPDAEGLALCKDVRSTASTSSILFLTARGTHEDKLEGFEAGADDYLVKPFSIDELTARIKALLRRKERVAAPADSRKEFSFGPLVIDTDKLRATYNNKDLGLTQIELKLLTFLAREPGKVFTREELLSEVWGYKFQGYEHTVNTHINRLRLKVEPNPSEPMYVLTAWGKGYKFMDGIQTI